MKGESPIDGVRRRRSVLSCKKEPFPMEELGLLVERANSMRSEEIQYG